MKKLGRLTLLIFTICFFGSCQDPVQVKLDEGAELLVIDAFVESKYDMMTIHIHKNSTYFNTRDPEPVKDAQVRIHNLTANVSCEFFNTREDRYEAFISASKDNFFKVGHQYRLDVGYNGATYSALTTMPRAAKIDSIGATLYKNNPVTGQPMKDPYYVCTLWAKDKADNNPDYYWIKSRFDSTVVNICIDGTGGIVKDATQDSVYFTSPYNLLAFQTFYPGTRCNVEVHAINKDTYYFLAQAVKQVQNGGMFATTPENVKSNFVTPTDAKTKAVGWFSVANVVAMHRDLPR